MRPSARSRRPSPPPGRAGIAVEFHGAPELLEGPCPIAGREVVLPEVDVPVAQRVELEEPLAQRERFVPALLVHEEVRVPVEAVQGVAVQLERPLEFPLGLAGIAGQHRRMSKNGMGVGEIGIEAERLAGSRLGLLVCLRNRPPFGVSVDVPDFGDSAPGPRVLRIGIEGLLEIPQRLFEVGIAVARPVLPALQPKLVRLAALRVPPGEPRAVLTREGKVKFRGDGACDLCRQGRDGLEGALVLFAPEVPAVPRVHELRRD